MALAEDAASVLEEFVQNVANLPAEIAHLLEEIQAKDRIVQDCRSNAASRDASIQKFFKANGAGQVNPKEEPYSVAILAAYDKAQIYQEEKLGLSDRAAALLDRQIKRLDLKIRDLQNEGAIAIDPQLPSLLNSTSTLSTRLPPLSTSTTGTSTPLQPISNNAVPSTTIANSNPLARLTQPTHRTRQPSPLTTTAPISATSTLAPNASSGRSARSPSIDPSKRRRLNATHLSIPPTSSSLRQSSLGPGTPKSSTQQPSSRGGSAGPRPQPTTAAQNKAASKPPRPLPHQRIGHLNPSAKPTKKRSRPGKRTKAAGAGGSDTGNDSESILSEVDDRERDMMDVDGAGDDGEEEEGEGDDR
ncbi:MAG: hypothetical protein LQ338_007130, partial [Usnochroma carphineum]